MKPLHQNWITQGLLDFEYKRYVLLAYLKDVSMNFNENKVYPFLSDLFNHYNNLVSLQKKKSLTEEKFPKQIKKIDLENMTLEYEGMMSKSDHIAVIENIVEFAIPKMHEQVKEGKSLYNYVENSLNVFPIGVIPLNKSVGYMLVKNAGERETEVYQYAVTIYENTTEKFRALKTKYIESYNVSLSNSYEQIKIDLIRSHKRIPNPALYVVESSFSFPKVETLLPIAKRSLIKLISAEE